MTHTTLPAQSTSPRPRPSTDPTLTPATEALLKRATRPGIWKRRGRPSLITGAAVFVLTVGLTLAGCFVWEYVISSYLTDQDTSNVVSTWRQDNPLTAADVELHTDFDAFPPPVVGTGSDPWGLLIVPRWQGLLGVYDELIDASLPIREGTASKVLDTGAAGHYEDTALPGQVGNFSLAGHRRGHGDNFLHVDKLEPGDTITVETPEAWFVYKVTTHEIVTPDRWQVTAPVPGDEHAQPTERFITLTTCHSATHGAWGNDLRWVVHGTLIGWVEHDAGTPPAAIA